MDPDADAPGPPDPRRWVALNVCLVAGFMTLLDISIVNVALPSIRAALEATPSDLAWILSGYALAYGLVLIPAGRLGDARGRKRMFLVGLVVFILASAAAGMSPSASWLAAARVLQGVGSGMLLPQVAGLIQQLFTGEERGRAFGRFGSVLAVSTAVGPLAGGLIIVLGGDDQAWRWVFLVNVPICVVTLVLAVRLLPPDPGTGRMESLDPVGVALLATGLFLLLLPIVESERVGDQPWLWALLPAGLAVLAGFLAWERHHRRQGRAPLVDFELWHRRSYAVGVVLALLYYAGFTSIFFVLTLFLQSGLGYSALEAGLATTPFAVGGAVGAWYGGRLVTRHGRALVVIGLGVTVVGLVAADLVVDVVDSRRRDRTRRPAPARRHRHRAGDHAQPDHQPGGGPRAGRRQRRRRPADLAAGRFGDRGGVGDRGVLRRSRRRRLVRRPEPRAAAGRRLRRPRTRPRAARPGRERPPGPARRGAVA